ncbi:hypothetical protein IIB49_03155 [Patescibacteria group bacterium]|nr:hypothetical protein [Patescibacteria group bacterium]
MFVCNRYQAVPVVDNTSNLEPVLSILNEIIDTHQKQATRMLTYEKVYSIKGWEYGDIVPLGSANNIVFRKENKERLSQLKPEEKLLEEVDSLNVYYREGEKLYGVYFGSCVDGSAGTWGCFGTNEIKSEKRASRYYNIWPQDLSIKLKDISTEGIKIPSGEYLAHKDFYDSLLTWSSNLLFLEDDKLYQRLWVSLE